MRQFNPLAGVRKNDRVVAHDIAAANGMDADFRRRAFADDAGATMPRGFFQLQFAHVRQNFRERFCRAAGRVFFQAMMHLDDFQIEIRPENFRRLAREPEQRVDAGGKIGRPDHGNLRFAICDLRFFGIGMAGGADDDRFLDFSRTVQQCLASRYAN